MPDDDSTNEWEEMARLDGSRSAMGSPEEVPPMDGLHPPGPVVINYADERAKRHDENRRKSRFYNAASLDGKAVPERHWLVRGLIPTGTVTLLSGDGGTGKSLVTLQLAAAVALGRKWLGRSVSSGQALFISAEDDEEELHRRIADVGEAEGVSMAELDQLTMRSLAGEDALLSVLDPRSGVQKASELYLELDSYMSDELKPAVLILDTLADLFPGNENDRGQVRQFIGLLRGLAIRHECAVVLLSHPSLTGIQNGTGISGSTGWHNSVRSRLYLHRVIQGEEEPNPDARLLECKKANYGPTGDEIALTWRNGVFVADEPETGLDRMAKRSKASRKFVELLRMLNDQGRDVNPSAGPNYAPSVFSKHPDAEGITKEAFRNAMEILFSNGAVRTEQIRRDGRLATVIREVK